MRPKAFLPEKEGWYIVEYGQGIEFTRERIYYNRKKKCWEGTKDSDFYKKNIVSFIDPKYVWNQE